MERAILILRLSREGAESPWHGVIELVGADMRGAVSSPADIAAFIETSFDRLALDEERARSAP